MSNFYDYDVTLFISAQESFHSEVYNVRCSLTLNIIIYFTLIHLLFYSRILSIFVNNILLTEEYPNKKNK